MTTQTIQQKFVEGLEKRLGKFEEIYQDQVANKLHEWDIKDKYFQKYEVKHFLDGKEVEPTREMQLPPWNAESFVPGHENRTAVIVDKEGLAKYQKYAKIRDRAERYLESYKYVMSLSDTKNNTMLNVQRDGLKYCGYRWPLVTSLENRNLRRACITEEKFLDLLAKTESEELKPLVFESSVEDYDWA